MTSPSAIALGSNIAPNLSKAKLIGCDCEERDRTQTEIGVALVLPVTRSSLNLT